MKIAITGHTAGIGQALARVLSQRGHEIVGLSKRDGHNIRVIPKIAAKIEPCDMFINNAQAGYAQTELLYAVWESWQGQANKHIWCISTIMTQCPVDPPIPGQSEIGMSAYRNQKIALEQAINQLRWKKGWPSITLIRPGSVATQPGQVPGPPYCDVDAWADTIVAAMVAADQQNMVFQELSLGYAKGSMGL
jgi:NAD(P)-dependent dehydrogenase (short-subunit alcohol dehydrogenase family)